MDDMTKLMGGSNLQLQQCMIQSGLTLKSSKLISIIYTYWRYILPKLHAQHVLNVHVMYTGSHNMDTHHMYII